MHIFAKVSPWMRCNFSLLVSVNFFVNTVPHPLGPIKDNQLLTLSEWPTSLVTSWSFAQINTRFCSSICILSWQHRCKFWQIQPTDVLPKNRKSWYLLNVPPVSHVTSCKAQLMPNTVCLIPTYDSEAFTTKGFVHFSVSRNLRKQWDFLTV